MIDICFQVQCRRDNYTDGWFRRELGPTIKKATKGEVTLLTDAERFVLNTVMSDDQWQAFITSPEYAAINAKIDEYGDCYCKVMPAERL